MADNATPTPTTQNVEEVKESKQEVQGTIIRKQHRLK